MEEEGKVDPQCSSPVPNHTSETSACIICKNYVAVFKGIIRIHLHSHIGNSISRLDSYGRYHKILVGGIRCLSTLPGESEWEMGPRRLQERGVKEWQWCGIVWLCRRDKNLSADKTSEEGFMKV